MADPVPQFESEPITDERVIQLFILASTYGETMEHPGAKFAEAQELYSAWLSQEQAKVEATLGSGGEVSIAFDARRIMLFARGGMKDFAMGELADLETQIEFNGRLDSVQRNRLRGELDRFKLALGAI